MEERLQKVMSNCGVASRRASEKMILEGRVRVIFGKPVPAPQGKASDRDLVKGFSDEIRDIIIAMQNQYKGDAK